MTKIKNNTPGVPSYPTLEEFLQTPKVLLKHTPKKWKHHPAVWPALVAFVVGGSSVQGQTPEDSPALNLTEVGPQDPLNKVSENTPKADSSLVAPLFNHGDGVGTFGCVVIMPPVFINEDEARAIIINELLKEKINFSTEEVPESKVTVQSQKIKYNNENGNWKRIDTTVVNTLKFDGYCKDLNFVFEYISSEDHSVFCDDEEDLSSVYTEDVKATAEKVQKAIQKNGEVNAVVFYDPMPYGDRNASVNARKQEAEKMLRAQVSNFIDWLKKQHVIKD